MAKDKDDNHGSVAPTNGHLDEEADECVPLLSGGSQVRYSEPSIPVRDTTETAVIDDEAEDEESDEEELDSEFFLSRASSFPSSSGLAPESLEPSMLRGDRRRGSRSSRRSKTMKSQRSISSDAVSMGDPDGGELSPSISPRTLWPNGNNGGDNGGSNGDVEATAGMRANDDPLKSTFIIDSDNRRFWVIFLTVMLTYFIACFDGTIMASSHPVITSYFHSSQSASWLTTSFLLTSTAFQPLVGRLSDTLGRKPLYMFTISVLTLATAWCALAGSMTSFIVARAFCGLGAGGMMALGSIIISDIVDIERRGTYQSYINIVYGLAAASGAALGGLMADSLGWRWEFGIQVFPLLICLVLSTFSIPRDLGLHGERETFVEAMSAFDFTGSLLLTTSVTFLILAMSLGGNLLPWSHPFIIASLVVVGVCFPVCLYVESRAKRPIMPLVLLHSTPRANIIFSNFFASFNLNAILFNAPLYFQAVLLTTATESGLYLVVPTVVASVCGTLTGFLISYTKRLKWPLFVGTTCYVLGTVSLASMQRGWPTIVYLLCLVPGAMGQGFQFPGTFIAILAASEQREQAVVTSTLVLWRALGSVLGVACSSLVMQNALRSYLQAFVSTGGEPGHDEAWKQTVIEKVRESVGAVSKLQGPVLGEVVASYEAALRVTFLVCVGFAVVSWLLIAPIRVPKLGDRNRR